MTKFIKCYRCEYKLYRNSYIFKYYDNYICKKCATFYENKYGYENSKVVELDLFQINNIFNNNCLVTTLEENTNNGKNNGKNNGNKDENKKDEQSQTDIININIEDVSSFHSIINHLFSNDINSKSNNNEKDKDNNDDEKKITMNKENKRECKKRKFKDDYGVSYDEYRLYPYEWLGNDINTITDLIKIGKNYKQYKKRRFNLNIYKIKKLVEPLEELENMVGLTDIKKVIFEEIIYHLQELDDTHNEMHHTAIFGPPGVGKTKLSHILAKIYNKLGFLESDKVVSVKRDDLVAGYLGQTALKTRKKLDSALGGVLLIDEAYSLGCKDKGGDSYSNEVIDLLTHYLSEHADKMICIIAGYKEALEERFFMQNEGLSRRFTHRYYINGYDGIELRCIFKKIVESKKWKFNENTINDEWFTKNKDSFTNFGGDIETLFNCCKKSHSKRLLKISSETKLNRSKKKLTLEDLNDGLKLMIQISKEKKDNNNIIQTMYS